MKRTIILLVLFLALGAGAYYLLKTEDDSSSISNKENANFAVKNLDEIQKIFIADKNDYRVLLERKNGGWIYNKKYKARETVVGDLLKTIRDVKMMYTTPRAAEKNMIKNLATGGVKVEIYGKNDKVLKTYYVGGSTKNSMGTYMIMEGADEPYICHDPTFQGMLKGKFLKTPDAWKSLKLYGETVEEIQSLSVEYPKQKNKSFKIERTKDDDFDVKPFHETTPRSTKPLIKSAVEKYLMEYRVLHAEAFDNEYSFRDSVASSVPFATLTLTNTDGETKTGRLFPIILKDEYGNPINYSDVNMKAKGATHRYFLDYPHDESFRLIQHRVFEKVFWSYDYFFQK